MIGRPSPEAEECLARLENDQDFQVVMGWLIGEHEAVIEKNTWAHGEVELRQGQGCAQVLSVLIECANNARQNADKRRRR